MKGHVPEEHLAEYRRRRTMAWQADSIGNQLSGLGHYYLANQVWHASVVLRKWANELRVELKSESSELA